MKSAMKGKRRNAECVLWFFLFVRSLRFSKKNLQLILKNLVLGYHKQEKPSVIFLVIFVPGVLIKRQSKELISSYFVQLPTNYVSVSIKP